jgi:hypothetical protein
VSIYLAIIMYIKIILITAVCFNFLLGCQPEQMRWSEDIRPERATAGDSVYEALSKNALSANLCTAQRARFLESNKDLFIKNLNTLVSQLNSQKSSEENILALAKFIQADASTEIIYKLADVIEASTNNLTQLDLVRLGDLLKLNNYALEKIFLALIHDKKFEELIKEIEKNKLSALQISIKIEPILKRAFAGIDISNLLLKIVKTLDNSSETKKLGKKLLTLVQKFDPEALQAALELQRIMYSIYPDMSLKDMIMWTGILDQNPRGLTLSSWETWLLVGFNNIFKIKEVPEFLPLFISRITKDTAIYDSLMSNTKILYDRGILNDIVELAREAEKFQKKLKLNQENLLNSSQILTLAQKLFVANKSILKAPVVIIAKVLLQVLGTNEESESQVNIKAPDIANHIESWSKTLVEFMRDSHRGLIHILSLIKAKF